MSNLFKKAAVFTDIHFGYRNNSREFNIDCENFIEWFIEEAKQRGTETCIFCGDFHHNRSNINISTLNYSVSNLKKLSESFENVYMIVGNHDLFYRSKREINSFPYADLFPNIIVINDDITEIGDVALVPWLINDEWKKVKKLKSRYIFGHFELPNFMMNALVEMPDHHEISIDDLKVAEYVFSGHFHKRQSKGNIHYIGSPFAHNYADVWDTDRGAMFLEWGGTPEYVNYDGPRYVRLNLSDLIDNPDEFLNKNTYCRAIIDVPVSYEEANFIKETFISQFNPRELSLLPAKNENSISESTNDGNIVIESIDQIVYNQLKSVESEVLNTNKLIEIYKNL